MPKSVNCMKKSKKKENCVGVHYFTESALPFWQTKIAVTVSTQWWQNSSKLNAEVTSIFIVSFQRKSSTLPRPDMASIVLTWLLDGFSSQTLLSYFWIQILMRCSLCHGYWCWFRAFWRGLHDRRLQEWDPGHSSTLRLTSQNGVQIHWSPLHDCPILSCNIQSGRSI